MGGRREGTDGVNVVLVDARAPFACPRPWVPELRRQMLRRGHCVELIWLPAGGASRAGAEALIARTLEGFWGDRVVALGFPAMLVRHANKLIWAQDRLHFGGANEDWRCSSVRLALGEATRSYSASTEVARDIWAAGGIFAPTLAIPAAGPAARDAWDEVVRLLTS